MKKPSVENGNISSAEMTAHWRSIDPISHDFMSYKMVTDEGVLKAKQFEEKYSYPLVGRKVAVRARFFLDSAVTLLKSQNYDSCISFASGFSLLTYYIFENIKELCPSLFIFDTDLPDIIEERAIRLKKLENEVKKENVEHLYMRVFDLEKACREKKHLKDLFSECKKPVFLIEGVIYFVSCECVEWLMNEIRSYEDAGIILDYWPEEGMNASQCFNYAMNNIKGFVREEVVSFFKPGFWNKENFVRMTQDFKHIKDISIKEVENQLAKQEHENPQFTDENTFFPVRLFAGCARI